MSSYIRFEILLFFRSLEAGAAMLMFYRLLCLPERLHPMKQSVKNIRDLLYWLAAGLFLFAAAYRYDDGNLRLFMLPGVAFGGIFANFALNRLLFLVKRCKISSYKHTKRRLYCFRRGRRFEKVKKEKK